MESEQRDGSDALKYRNLIEYDNKSRVSKFHEATSNGTHKTEYQYDKDNRVKALRYDGSNNYLVNYTFDKLNRITSRKLRNVNMKQSYYNIIRSAVFDFLVLGILIFIAEMGILPKKLRPINDPRWFFFIVFILWIIWLGFSDAASAIIEYCFKHPVLRKRAVISNAVKKKTYKYCKFKNITLITADGLVGVYEYVGEFNSILIIIYMI